MKILVTGGCGFIGSHLVAAYQGRAEIVVLDNLRTGTISNLDGLDCQFVNGSITDAALVEQVMTGVDYVFHLAALVSVPESIQFPMETVAINVTGLLNVLESARRNGVRKLCFASSAAVYGENPANPKTENLPPDPRSPYAITKLDGEFYCSLYQREGRLDTVALRLFNVFGPRQDAGSAYAAAIPIFLERALASRDLVIYGDGGQTRDFIAVGDIVEAFAFAAETPELTGVYNAGYGNSVTIKELAETITQRTGSGGSIVHEAPRPGDLRHSTSDPTRLLKAGWKPKHTLQSALDELIHLTQSA